MSADQPGGPVVLAYDGSEQAKHAIATAGRLLPAGRRAVVLTVWERLDTVPFWGAPMTVIPQEAFDEVVERAGEVAAEGAELARAAGFAAEPLVVEGGPAWKTIAAAAREQDAELIVMGSHGRTGASYVLVGSVANAVAQHAHCPVLIDRHPGSGTEGE
jgi:nucleotide-binding universal stress UspA family protein